MIDKRKELVLEKFFKDFLSWKVDNLSYWILAGIFETICVIFMCIPYQKMSVEDLWVPIMVGVAGTMFYISPYIYYRNEGKEERIYDIICYLPVSLRELRMFRLKKTILFCLKMYLIFFAGQIIFSLICYHGISWGAFLYPFVLGLVVPLLLTGIYLRVVK